MHFPDELCLEVACRVENRLDLAVVSKHWYAIARDIAVWLETAKEFGYPFPKPSAEYFFKDLKRYCVEKITNCAELSSIEVDMLLQTVFPIHDQLTGHQKQLFRSVADRDSFLQARNQLLAFKRVSGEIPGPLVLASQKDVEMVRGEAEGTLALLQMRRGEFQQSCAVFFDRIALTALPEQFPYWERVTSLFLSHNLLKQVPVSNLTNLLALHLQHNLLKELPESIWTLTKLRSLNLGHNLFEKLPESLQSLTNLTTLDLSHNQLKRAPDFSSLVQMRRLKFEANPLKSLPKGLEQMPSLETLYLDWKLAEMLPQQVRERVEELEVFSKPAPKIEEQENVEPIEEILENIWNVEEIDPSWILYLERLGLTSVPEEVFMQRKGFLDLSHNKLRFISFSIENLTLTVLHLNHNQLRQFPEAVLSLRSLKSLQLQDNQIDSVPSAIVKLQNLEMLNLAGNGLKSLPEAIAFLDKLRRLKLERNQIDYLPNGLDALPQLEALSVDRYLLDQVPYLSPDVELVQE